MVCIAQKLGVARCRLHTMAEIRSLSGIQRLQFSIALAGLVKQPRNHVRRVESIARTFVADVEDALMDLRRSNECD
jgi:hypothetical protein